jgi:hypothetical protein
VVPEGHYELDLRRADWTCCNADYGLCCAGRYE